MDGLEREIEATIYDFKLNGMTPRRTAKRIMALIAERSPVAEVPCGDGVMCLDCLRLESMLQLALIASRARLLNMTNSEYDEIFDKIEAYFTEKYPETKRGCPSLD